MVGIAHAVRFCYMSSQQLQFFGQKDLADFDIILAGGGLANTLIALALSDRRPEVRVLIVEAGERIGGDHTWCLHGTDIAPEHRGFLAPLLRRTWPDQMVIFPRITRTLSTSYNAMSSQSLRDAVMPKLQGSVRANTRLKTVAPDHVELDGGQTLTAHCVIDGRGWQPVSGLALAYQKFYGIEVETLKPHGLTRPVIMDARVAQTDGFRFVYCLPYSDTHLLIEDTFYSDDPAINRETSRRYLEHYATDQGWSIASVHRDEVGVLPIVLAGHAEAFWPYGPDQARSGLRAGLFHPTTGYSLPDAIALAHAIADCPQLDHHTVARTIRDLVQANWDARGYYRLLNRLLFVAASGEQRRNVMQRFYHLPQSLIERFYAGQTTPYEKARILSGRPPVRIKDAVMAMPPAAGRAFAANATALQPSRSK